MERAVRLCCVRPAPRIKARQVFHALYAQLPSGCRTAVCDVEPTLWGQKSRSQVWKARTTVSCRRYGNRLFGASVSARMLPFSSVSTMSILPLGPAVAALLWIGLTV
jgi:hypothetical protein